MRLVASLAVGFALLLASPAYSAPSRLAAAPIPNQGPSGSDARLAFGSDGTLVAVWHEGQDTSQTVRTATRPPGGSFGPIDTLAGPGIAIGFPRVAVDGQGTTLVTWISGAGGGYAVRPPGGSFGPAVDIPRPAGEGVSSPIEVTFDGQGNALAAWVGTKSTMAGLEYNLRASVRPPGGSFGSPESLDSGLSNVDVPGTPSYALDSVDVASAGGDLIASWARRCCFSGSEDASVRAAVRPPGGPFRGSETLASAPTGAASGVTDPRLAGSADGSAVIVWTKLQSLSTGNVSSCTRPPGGSWDGCTIENVSGDGSDPRLPDVGMDAHGNAAAVWTRKAPGATDPHAVQTAGRSAGTSGWTPLGTFSEPGTELTQATIATSPQGASIVAWRHGTDRIDGAARPPGGAFGPSQPLSASGGNPMSPALAMDPDGNGAAAWQRGTSPDTLVEVGGYDGAGPRLNDLSIPSAGRTKQPLTFSVTPTDVWSPVQSVDWAFADGSGAPGSQVTHTYRRVGGRFTATVSATDSLGNTSGASGVTRVRDTERPVVSRLRMARRRFAVARGRTPLVAKRVPRGSAFRFRLSEPAKVKIRIEQRVKRGRRAVYRKVAVLTRRRGRTGKNSVGFTGRIKRRALAPGAYRATIRAVDAGGNSSRARRVAFKIVR